MSFAKNVGGAMCLAVVTLGFAVSSHAQGSLSPAGTEQFLTDSIPGTQLHPALALNESGGFLVWEDNAIDGAGQGIGLIQLNTQFRAIGAVQRVNLQTAGHQEKPQVAVLKNGTAVVAWQSEKVAKTGNHSDIALRFVTASGSFLTTEILAHKYITGNQVTPVIAALPDGNALVIWASENQDGSMLGVYGRRFTASGQPIGNEFPLHTTTAFNQKNPSVAVLDNGNVAVAWVSESVGSNFAYANIIARLFSSTGQPLTAELPISGSQTVSSHPSIAAGVDNGFTVAWGKNLGAVYGSRVVNGEEKQVIKSRNNFDIFARSYNSLGEAISQEYALNSITYGDQYAPKLVSHGTSLLAVWTTLGHDGSREGVFGRTLLSDGTPVGADFQINTSTLNQQFYPAVAADGTGRYLVAWSGYTEAVDHFELFSQSYETGVIHANMQRINQEVELSWNANPGRRYQIQFSSDLQNWQDVPGQHQASGRAHSVRLPSSDQSGFYRVIQLR